MLWWLLLVEGAIPFAWMQGSSTARYQIPSYGVKGEYAGESFPGSRTSMAVETDGDVAYVFGGKTKQNLGSGNENVYLADLWTFNMTSQMWKWTAGEPESSLPPQLNDTIGMNPGSRYGMASWFTNKEMCVYGGRGTSLEDGPNDYLADIWCWNSVHNDWRYVNGSLNSDVPGDLTHPGGRYEMSYWFTDDLYIYGGKTVNGYTNDVWRFNGSWYLEWGLPTTDTQNPFYDAGLHAPGNFPGGRWRAWSFAAQGGKYLFAGLDRSGKYHNDVWLYNDTGWFWEGGSSHSSSTSDYGEWGQEGEQGTHLYPSPRYSNYWSSQHLAPCGSGHALRLFSGGYGRDHSGSNGYLSDIWTFNVDTSEFAWVDGSSSRHEVQQLTGPNEETVFNDPGARSGSFFWPDVVGGKYWMYGGYRKEIGGYSSDLWRLDISHLCNPCLAGTYNLQDTDSCLQCDRGKFSGHSSYECVTCPSGKWNDLTGQIDCTGCMPGEIGSGGTSACAKCPASTYQDEALQKFCESCGPGTFSDEGASACSQCPVNFWSPTAAAYECTSCIDNAVTEIEGATELQECLCGKGYFGEAFIGNNCTECPEGAMCDVVNVTVYGAQDGYWQDGLRILRCFPPEACVASTQGLTSCKAGYEGWGCGKCTGGFYRTDGVCATCPTLQNVFLVILIIVFVVLAFYLVKQATPRFASMESMGVCIIWLQIISLYSSLPFDWPPILLTLFKFISIFNFNIDLFAPECSLRLDYWGKWWLKMSSPFVFALLFGLVYLLEHYWAKKFPEKTTFLDMKPKEIVDTLGIFKKHGVEQSTAVDSLAAEIKRRATMESGGEPQPVKEQSSMTLEPLDEPTEEEQKETARPRKKKKGASRYLHGYVWVLSLLYTFLISTILDPLSCTKQQDGTWTQVSNSVTQCYTAEWAGTYLPSIMFFFLLYLVGIPVLYGGFFYHFRKDTFSNRFLGFFGNLVLPYREKVFWWELVNMLRKLSIVVTLAMGNVVQHTTLQLFFLIGVLCAYLMLHTWVQPYRSRQLNALTTGWIVAALLCVYSAPVFTNQQFGLQEKNFFAYGVVFVFCFACLYTAKVAWNEHIFINKLLGKSATSEGLLNRVRKQKEIVKLLYPAHWQLMWPQVSELPSQSRDMIVTLMANQIREEEEQQTVMFRDNPMRRDQVDAELKGLKRKPDSNLKAVEMGLFKLVE